MEASTTSAAAENEISGKLRLTRRSRLNQVEKGSQENLEDTTDSDKAEANAIRENANNISRDELKRSTTPNIMNSSTPRRRKDPLALLHSNLSPKYIGFTATTTTPTTTAADATNMDSSMEDKSRSLRKRHNLSSSAAESSSTKDNIEKFSANTSGGRSTPTIFSSPSQSPLGYVRRTPKSSKACTTNTPEKKNFVSPIDKLLKKNGSLIENDSIPFNGNKREQEINEAADNVKEHLTKQETKEDNMGCVQLDDLDLDSLENEDITNLSSTPLVELKEVVTAEEIKEKLENLTTTAENIDKSLKEELHNSTICNDGDAAQDELSMENKVTLVIDITSSEEPIKITELNEEKLNNCEEACNQNRKTIEMDIISVDNDDDDDDDRDTCSIKIDKFNYDEETESGTVANSEDLANDKDIFDEHTNTQDILEDMPENVIENMPEDVEDMPEYVVQDMPEAVIENIAEVKKLNSVNNNEHCFESAEKEQAEINVIEKALEEETKQTQNVKLTEDSRSDNIKSNQNIEETNSNESESHNDYVEDATTTTSAKSPSTVSVDSAKGSSIINEGSWMTFSTGDLYWGQIYNFCYWPCMVCPDPDGKTITTEENDKTGDHYVLVHVRFFADNGRRNWVKRENLMPFLGLDSYQEKLDDIKEKHGTKGTKLYVPAKKNQSKWNEAVNEANIVADLQHTERLKKFFEIFEQSRTFQKLEKQRRKSMFYPASQYTESTSDIGSLYGSSDNVNFLSMGVKRERSTSPFSPAYSPLKSLTAKRRKLSQEKEELYSSQTSLSNSVLSADTDILSNLEFRKYFMAMREAHIPHNTNEKLEKSFIKAVRNIWGLKEIYEHEKELQRKNSTLVENEYRNGNNNGNLKRLSTRLKTILARKSLGSQHHTPNSQTMLAPERSSTPISSTPTTADTDTPKVKAKRIQNRPMFEVIDDIFDLDSKYLFKGLTREPVCKYCCKPGGNLKRCSKNCSYFLHAECLGKDFDDNGKMKRVRKSGQLKQHQNDIDLLDQKSNITVAEEQPTIDSNNSVETVLMSHHVTSEAVQTEIICKECANNEPINCCMVCKAIQCPKNPEGPLVKCTMSQCDRYYHPACCKYWPQAKLTISNNHIESFRCPSHVCHTCVSDDPKGKFQHLSSNKITKCLKCPATYHTDSTCIPAGSQMLTSASIICPRHAKLRNDVAINVNWCFICVGGGQLVCCETCPTAVHASCLKIAIDANEGYICEECESGRLPLYGEMVWAKFNNFRWWPAVILPPTEIPKNILKKQHNPNDFVVRFFGTHDHGWISRRRVYLYLEGDSSEPPKTKSDLDQRYNLGIAEAKEVYELIKAKKQQHQLSNDNKEKLHPQPYVRIKSNRPVPPVKLHVDMESVSKCECNPNDVNPCGPDSDCLNRVLYHECNPKLCPAGEKCQNQVFESKISPRLDVVYMKERGFGLVCKEPITAGSFVIEYVGEIINDNEFRSRMSQKSMDREENFYFLSVEKDYIIDAGPKGNLARFMNHSCDPNCETQKWCVNSLNRVGLFAIKDIPENTELTFNYHWDDLLGNEKKTCYCGSKKCAGQIGGKIKEPEVLREPVAVPIKGKNKSKTKPLKRLATTAETGNNKKGRRPKVKSELNVKSKKRKAATTVAESLIDNEKTKAIAIKKEPTIKEEKHADDDDDVTVTGFSRNRILPSPDIFC